MLLDIVAGLLGSQVAGLLGSQLMRSVAFDVATSLLCQGIQHTVTTATRPRSSAQAKQADASPDQADALPDRRSPTRPTAHRRLRRHPHRARVTSFCCARCRRWRSSRR